VVGAKVTVEGDLVRVAVGVDKVNVVVPIGAVYIGVGEEVRIIVLVVELVATPGTDCR